MQKMYIFTYTNQGFINAKLSVKNLDDPNHEDDLT